MATLSLGLTPPATAADRDFILTLNASDLGMDPADLRGGGGNGSFEARYDWAHASDYPRKYIRFADISGDGKADYLVVYDGGAVRAWLNRGGN
ncbi:hypothetical protein ACIHFD_18050 [Nonomuraea sp. NPDC051941]|uniref:hypothetical protein n=1 Tax=Nonomuraea sp. NPDC051941 TaxID=3364373 RepID=UPI0037CB5F1B